MDTYLTPVPTTAHKFVHPLDKVGPIWTGFVRVDPVRVDAIQVGRQYG